MRRQLCLALALLGCTPAARALGQEGPEPHLVLTLLAGVVNGTSLWTVARQPFCPTAQCDTLRLARDMSSSLALGVEMTYFPGPTFGIQGEIAYVGLPLGDACAVQNGTPTPQSIRVCADIGEASHSTSAVAISASALLRASPRRNLSPFVRGGLGVIVFNRSTIEMSGATGDTIYDVIRDDSPGQLSPSVVLAAGATLALGGGYQFRLEARDVIARFERVIGPADGQLVAPTGRRFSHHVGLTMGLDVVLERKRGRRY